MQHTFKTLNKQELTINNGLIEPFDYRKIAQSHYTLSTGAHIRAFIPRKLIDENSNNSPLPHRVFQQVQTYNQLIYNPAIFQKVLEHQTEILQRPEYFLLRLPALFINHEFPEYNTTFTLGSLLESWQYNHTLFSVDDAGELMLMAVLHSGPGNYTFRAWSPQRKDFRDIGISGSTSAIIEEFEQLNKRYPVQLKENDFFASRLLEELLL